MTVEHVPGSSKELRPNRKSLPQMRYSNAYTWFLFFSSLDIMLTWAILSRSGTEVNPLAAAVINIWGLPGAIVFKFSLMMFVIVVCEVVGRMHDRRARFLIWLAVSVSSVPVVYSLGLLVLHTIYVAA